MPKISAVMALYNTPLELLKPTLESILSQSFKDFELIIIDDCSSFDYCDFFNSFKDDRIKYQKLEKNSGPGAARNYGIKKAQGEYIAIVDSDDIYLENRFKIQADFLDKNPNISLISSSSKLSNSKRIMRMPEKDDEIKTWMLFNSAFINPCAMFRKEDFLKNNLFYPQDINFAEDYKLWLEAMFCKLETANIQEPLMIYTRRANQLSKVKEEIQNAGLKEIYKFILSKLEIDFSQKEIETQHKIYLEDFKNMEEKDIVEFFDKIINANKEKQIFNEPSLFEKKKETLQNFEIFKKKYFKIKLINWDLFLLKPFRFLIRKRV